MQQEIEPQILFDEGFRMPNGASDEHVLRLIEKNQCSELIVSLYCDPDSPPTRQLMERTRRSQLASR